MEIIDGKKIQKEVLEKIKKEISLLSFTPVFCDILVGSDPSSVQYVKIKKKVAEFLGIKFYNANFEESITTTDLIKEIEILNKVPNMSGIIIQLPLPKHIEKQSVFNAIDSSLDVDCLSDNVSQEFYQGKSLYSFPAGKASVYLLDSLNLDLFSKKIVVLGQGMLVGRPVTSLLRLRNLQVFPIDLKTPDKEKLIKEADIIISGIGQARFIKGDMIKKGAILIDAGTSEDMGGIVGDVDLDSVKDVASFISPVPGGVGPVTVAMLFKNVLEVAKSKMRI